MSDLTWGVDGYGTRHYLCRYCELQLGTIENEIYHKCDKTKPRYHNRDKKCQNLKQN